MSLFKNLLLKKICLVTGGRTGMGRAIVKEFLKQGAYVMVIGRDFELLKEAFRSNKQLNKKLFLFECNITDYSSVKLVSGGIIAKFKRIDILVNNASINFMIQAEKLRQNMIDLSIDTNLKGHIYLSTFIGNQMKHQRGFKRIINITAYSGGKAYPGFSHFHASKAGLDAFTRTLAIEWSKYKILVNAISPGPVLTENFIHAYTRLQRMNGKSSLKELLRMKERIPLGDFISTSDIVDAILFLSSSMSNNITGQIIAVDGGVGITNEYFLEKMNLK